MKTLLIPIFFLFSMQASADNFSSPIYLSTNELDKFISEELNHNQKNNIYFIHGTEDSMTKEKYIKIFYGPHKSSSNVCFLNVSNYKKSKDKKWEKINSYFRFREQLISIVKPNSPCNTLKSVESYISTNNHITDNEITEIYNNIATIKNMADKLKNEKHATKKLQDPQYKFLSIQTTGRYENQVTGYILHFSTKQFGYGESYDIQFYIHNGEYIVKNMSISY